MKFVGIFTLFLLMNLHSSFAQTAGSDVVYLSQEENQFYQMVNDFRSQLGLPTLQIHVFLQNAAKKHSEWMASQDFLSHYGPVNNETPFQRMADEGYTNYTFAGENVACGNGDAVKTFRQWAFSPGHLANMINPHFRHMGISRAGTGNEHCPFYWTNDFGTVSDLSQDQANITDLQVIAAAVTRISGVIPADKTISLPSASTPETDNENTNPTPNTFAMIQCVVPYATAKNILSFIPNTDAILEITQNTSGGYQTKVSYLQNGASTNYYPILINNMSVMKSSSFPLYLIFSAPSSRVGGFTIQYNTDTSSAQFDSYPAIIGGGSTILCSTKY
jgi:hypothetical protein